jgi:hypothetical protein
MRLLLVFDSLTFTILYLYVYFYSALWTLNCAFIIPVMFRVKMHNSSTIFILTVNVNHNYIPSKYLSKSNADLHPAAAAVTA